VKYLSLLLLSFFKPGGESMIRLFAVFALLLLSGCSSLDKYKNMEKPKVDLDTVEMKDADTKGANLLFGVKIDNPNDFPLEVDSVRYDIEVGGKKIADDEIKQATKVAAKSIGTVFIPLRVSYADVFTSIGDFLRNDMTEYRLKGTATIGWLTLPFDEAGKFKISNGKFVHEK
jgi:LEA14-like dessication related protein